MRFRFLPLLMLLAGFSARAEIVDIDNAQLARLAVQGVPVIDIRTEGEWKETGIVPGSRLLTLFDEKGRPDPGFVDKVKGIAKPDQPVILICRSGNRSKVGAQMLEQQGRFAKVYNVREGVRGWAKEGRVFEPVGAAVASCPAGARC